MSKIVISDFLLALGFDGKEVDKGLDNVEKRLGSLGKTQRNISKNTNKTEKTVNKTRKKGLTAAQKTAKKQREILSIRKAQHTLEKSMAKSQSLGMKRNHYHMKALKKDFKDVNKIKQYTQNLNEKIWRQEQSIAKAAANKVTKPVVHQQKKSPKKTPDHLKYKSQRRAALSRAIKKQEFIRANKPATLQQRLETFKADKSANAARVRAQADIAAAKAAKDFASQQRKAMASQRRRDRQDAKAARIKRRNELAAAAAVKKFTSSLHGSSVNSFLRTIALLGGGLYGLSRILSGVTGAAKKQMDAERALVGVQGVGKALTFDKSGKSTGIVAGSGGLTDTQFFEENKKFLKGLVRTFAVELPAATETWRAVLGASIQQLKDPKSGITTDNLKDLMVGVSAGAAAFKMGAEDQKLMWLGITQIMQKGKVQAEEMTRQIGQRNPLAIQAMLKAMQKVYKQSDMTHETMYKMMREGKILAKDVMPEWGRQMKELADNMTDGDYIEYMEKSLGGAVQTFRAQMSLAWNDVFSDDAFKPMAGVMSTFRQMAEESRFITDQAGAYLGNVAVEVNKRLQPVLENMKMLNSDYRKNILLNKDASTEKTLEIAKQVSEVFEKIESFALGFYGGMKGVLSVLDQIWTVVKPLVNSMLDMFGASTNKPAAELLGYLLGAVAALKIMIGLTGVLFNILGGGLLTKGIGALAGTKFGQKTAGAAASGLGKLAGGAANVAAMVARFIPILAIVTAIGTLIYQYFTNPEFKKFIDDGLSFVADWIVSKFNLIVDTLKAVFDDVVQWIKDKFNFGVEKVSEAVVENITQPAKEIWKDANNAWDNLDLNPFDAEVSKESVLTNANPYSKIGSPQWAVNAYQKPTEPQRLDINVGVDSSGNLIPVIEQVFDNREAEINDTQMEGN